MNSKYKVKIAKTVRFNFLLQDGISQSKNQINIIQKVFHDQGFPTTKEYLCNMLQYSREHFEIITNTSTR